MLLHILFAMLLDDMFVFFIFIPEGSICLFWVIDVDNFGLILLWFFKFIDIVRIGIGLDIFYVLKVVRLEVFIEIAHFNVIN